MSYSSQIRHRCLLGLLALSAAALSAPFALAKPSDDGMRARQDINSELIARLETKNQEQDIHLEASDSRINVLSTQVAGIEGVGGAILGVLVVLNMVGLLKPKDAATLAAPAGPVTIMDRRAARYRDEVEHLR